MFKIIQYLRHSLISRLILMVGITLLISVSTWAYFSIEYQKEKFMNELVIGTDRLSNTIKLGTHYAMMLNSRDDINQIITNIGKQKEIKNIRIYNKEGQIKFSNIASEVDLITNIEAEACYICHKTDPPTIDVDLKERTRLYDSPEGYKLIGVISPIYNEPGCSSNSCHVHPSGKKILGALDVVVSLKESEEEIHFFEKGIIGLAAFVIFTTSAINFFFILGFVNRPINRLIKRTKLIAKGEYSSKVKIDKEDEIGRLADAIDQMREEIGKKQAELNRQKDEYQTLFERAPCIITVQDRDYKLIRYNQEFAEKFNPKPGDYCYQAYKGREEKCPICPVEKTFKDGKSHFSEEKGFSKDGTLTHWIVNTSPIKNDKDEIVAAMEMNLDITHIKQLEEKLKKSEKKYHEIFSNIPNPVFVLDMDTLEILDCNESVKAVYGYAKGEIISKSFLDLFMEEEKNTYDSKIKTSAVINQVKHISKAGKRLFVNIRISPAEYPGQRVLLVTTSNITERLEAEQQLIHASKMATLGEMATGVAHELNQPLSVIKTASNFFMKKVNAKEKIDDEILLDMSKEIDAHVDRAAKIINHMRQFGRKSDLSLEKVQVNEVLKKAFEIFSQQLKVRGIEVVWDIQKDLPMVMGDYDRLEQVFINLLINARDAVEDKWGSKEYKKGDKKISIMTKSGRKKVICEICDTGVGIPEPILDKIFEPFFTTKKVGEGTGLGLSISYGIIKDCGGSIKAVLNKDEGACFIITFPIPYEEYEPSDQKSI